MGKRGNERKEEDDVHPENVSLVEELGKVGQVIKQIDDMTIEADELIAFLQESGNGNRPIAEIKKAQQKLMEIGVLVKKLAETVKNLQGHGKAKRALISSLRIKQDIVEAYKGEADMLKLAHDKISNIMNREQFAELRQMRDPKDPLWHLFAAIALLLKVINSYSKDDQKVIKAVHKFIRSASNRRMILGLKVRDLEKATIERVKDFLNDHPHVTRQKIYEINKNVAVLEPWLRTILEIGQHMLIDGKEYDNVVKDIDRIEKAIELESEIIAEVGKCLDRIGELEQKVQKTLIDQNLIKHEDPKENDTKDEKEASEKTINGEEDENEWVPNKEAPINGAELEESKALQEANEKSEAIVKLSYIDSDGYTVTEIIETVRTIETIFVNDTEEEEMNRETFNEQFFEESFSQHQTETREGKYKRVVESVRTIDSKKTLKQVIGP